MRVLPPCRAFPWLAALFVCVACGESPGRATGNVPVKVKRIVLQEGGGPVIVLQEKEGNRWLPIWIGISEAESIARALEGRRARRPNTHDLAHNLLTLLEASVERCVVTELRKDVYYARLVLRVQGETLEVDSRPSDAIAIAIRANAPLFVHASLLHDEKKGTPSHSEREI